MDQEDELAHYVQQQVFQKARALCGSQHPMEMEGVLPLVKMGGR